LTFGGCPNRTPYKEIHSVPPGHASCASAKETTFQRFWPLPVGDSIRYRNQHRYEEQVRALFQEAVAVRLQTDSPVLAELSGGLDSSSVVCMANHLIRRGSVAAPRLVSVSYLWRNSLGEPFIRDVEAFCGIEGIHLTTHDNPLITKTKVGNAIPAGFETLWMSASAAASRLGARTLLTGYNGDLVMGNWCDDSMQVAASLRRFHIARAFEEALGWSKHVKTPVSRILWRAFRTALPPALGPRATFVPTNGSSVPKSTPTSLLPSFCERTGLFEKDGFFSTAWMFAPPERRKHLHALTMLLELRSLQPPEPLQHLDYTHPFGHRPLVRWETPRLCGGGSRSLTNTGVHRGNSLTRAAKHTKRKSTMDEQESLSHTKWEYKYHVVFIPKCRRKTRYQELRRHLGEVLRRLAEQKESQIEEGHLRPDHVHMMIAIPPKYAASQVIGYIKGKSAIHLARVYGERKRNFVGQHFWARGFYVSTVGRDEAVIREYIKKQGEGDKRLDQMNLWR